MDKIVVEFVPTAKEFARASYTFSAKNKSVAILRGLIAILILAACFFLVSQIAAKIYSTVIITLLFLLFLCFILLLPFIIYWRTLQKLSKQDQVLASTHYEFSEDGVLLFTPSRPFKYDWSTFQNACETKENYFLAYTANRRVFQFFPKRALLSIEQENLLRDLFRMKLGKITNLESGLNGWMITVATFLVTTVAIAFCGIIFVAYSLNS